MPPFPGEETLATVYADLHSYFTAPSPRPALHRFDKASYFYIYYNSTRQTSRVEAAINAGTPDQTAFNGFLDNVKVIHCHRFPTRVTLLVDGDTTNTSPTSPRTARDPDEWRLASSDPRDPGTSKYKIHTIDIYLWNQDDSKLVLDIFKRLLRRNQLDIGGVEEELPHHDMVSPVVQNLENVAISDPPYKDWQYEHASGPLHKPVQSPSPAAVANRLSATGQAPSISPASAAAKHAPVNDYTPLAYNPAAPAAPEPIAHREDTPPPVDAADGTGLTAAARHDNPYALPQHPQTFGGPPIVAPGAYGHYGSPPPPSAPSFGPHATTSPAPSFGPQAAATVPPPSFGSHASSTPLQSSPQTSVSTNFAPPPTSAAGSDSSRHPSTAAQTYVPHGQDPNSHIFGQPPVQTPGTQFYQSINDQPHKPLQHVQPQYPDYLAAGQAPAPAAPPLGGYSTYNYGQAQPPQPAATGGYDIHNQVYRPTESEHHTHHHSSKPSRSSNSQRKPTHTEKIEKGIGKWIKKVEKNFG
ncbi:hypothetical protein A1O7_01638 [Cladophialophora yegresii CBS 114405]|uniref:RNA recognition motif-containing protein n=1 Tax=Cladophialophora yegresii CBS 114405 TaxID=1182544 RepID=W9WB13_9EURO|nr:uncharacterized protein A1O7_01638 [Cladophialophora yegresii CBS 114405]EXJ65297.1 hypothetical protein A1O7_01638 [Cladophialophora yegresii CBS 114405]